MASRQVEEYIETMGRLEERGSPVTNGALAEERGVSPAAVTEMLQRLSDMGLVRYEARGPITLTSAGKSAAASMIRKHRLWERFLYDILGMHRDRVDTEACELEHATSPEVESLLAKAVSSSTCPHGDPIPVVPLSEGPFGDQTEPTQLPAAEKPSISLADIANGETGVVSVLPQGHRIAGRFLALGFVIGAEVRMIQNYGSGPVIALVRDTRVALGRPEARKIRLVRKESGHA